MGHIHNVSDTDAHFRIDEITREIIPLSEEQTVIMQYDHNSERVTFEIPRYSFDGHDMATCNIVEIHYLNVAGNKINRSAGVYDVTDFRISTGDENLVLCSWLISQNATRHAGTLHFAIRCVCSEDGEIDYAWNTAVCSHIVISEGIYCGDIVVEEYSDILEQWRNELFSAGIPSGGRVGQVLVKTETGVAWADI